MAGRRGFRRTYEAMDGEREGTMDEKTEGKCPVCKSGELIGITMMVGETELSFTTCHLCEAKWWYKDGEAVPLQSILGMVSPRET